MALVIQQTCEMYCIEMYHQFNLGINNTINSQVWCITSYINLPGIDGFM